MGLKGFQPGNKLGGRKAYTLEQEQVNKMRKLLDKDLAIAEKLQNGKELDPLDEKKLQILQSRILKFADKLHATKNEMDVNAEITSKIISVDE